MQFVKTLVFALCAIAAAACTDDGEAVVADPGPGAYVADYANNSMFFTNMAAPKMGDSPHKEVQIWYSSNVKELIKQRSFTVPVGTVSIKTANVDGKPGVDAVVVMVKKDAGFDAANGDWHYEMRSPDGAMMNDPMTNQPMAGAIAMCIGCHKAYKAKDYLGGTTLQ